METIAFVLKRCLKRVRVAVPKSIDKSILNRGAPMKNYYSFEISLLHQGNALAAGDSNFAKQAAIEHRVAKASWIGQKPNTYKDPHSGKTKSSSSKFLGAGTFKQVFETPARVAGQGQVSSPPIDFILAKMDCGRSMDVSVWKESFAAIDDMVKNMVLYGQARSTLYATFDDGIPRMYLYLPRVKGQELAVVAADSTNVDKNTRIRYFFDLYSELKTLHTAAFYHADFKPANAMADSLVGASLIDFGGVKRCWHPYRVHTPGYCICNKKYGDRFAKLYLRYRGKAAPKKYLDVISAIKDTFNQRHSELSYGRYKRQTINNKPWIFGAAYDLAALFLISLELGLWNDTTEPDFIKWLTTFFTGTGIQPVMAALRSEYTGVVPLDGRPIKLRVLSLADGIEVFPSDRPGIEPSAVREVIRRRYQEQLDFDYDNSPIYTAEDHTRDQAELLALDEAFQLFDHFSRIPHVYKKQEIGRGKTLETKDLVLTNLINSLTYINDPALIRTALTKIFAVSLVNRNYFGKTHTTSFNQLLTAAKTPELVPLIQKHFDGLFTAETTANEFHDRVLVAARGLVPPTDNAPDLGSQNAYGKSDRHKVMNMIMSETGVGPVPQSRTVAREMAKQIALQNQAKLATYNPIMATLISSQQSRTQSVKVCRKEREKMVSQIQKVFSELQGGCTDDDLNRFRQDLAIFYGP